MTTSLGRDAKRSVWAALGLVLAVGPAAAQPPGAMPARPANPQPVALALEDQFNRKTDLASYRGAVVVLVYGDRKGTDACRALGEKLHVQWHPAAQGQPPAVAGRAGDPRGVLREGAGPGERGDPLPDRQVRPGRAGVARLR